MTEEQYINFDEYIRQGEPYGYWQISIKAMLAALVKR